MHRRRRVPHGARQSAARWLVGHHARAGRLAEAALTGLGLSDDEDGLAWMYVAVLNDNSDLPSARQAVARYGLTPVTDREADLCIKLHVGHESITPDVRVLLDIIERLPRGRYRNWVRSLALHECLTPTGPSPGLAADVIDTIRTLAGEAGVDPDNPALTLPASPPEPPDPKKYQQLRASARLGRTPLATSPPGATGHTPQHCWTHSRRYSPQRTPDTRCGSSAVTRHLPRWPSRAGPSTCRHSRC
jgi:hypothetical protein